LALQVGGDGGCARVQLGVILRQNFIFSLLFIGLCFENFLAPRPLLLVGSGDSKPLRFEVLGLESEGFRSYGLLAFDLRFTKLLLKNKSFRGS
jgi:hypothetical protein